MNTMKNNFLIAITLLLSLTFSHAQSGSVKGNVMDNSKISVFGVNVIIKNSSQGVQSLEDGNFEISDIANGDHVLVISYLGFKTKEIPFSVSNNETKDFGSIILYEGNEILSEVTVIGERTNKFSRKETAYVAKLPLKNIENAQVYSTITSELLISQSVTTFAEALQNSAGVGKLWQSTGRSGDGAGYYSLRGFSVQPQLINGTAGITNGFINPSNVERIEVIKGPSATLFGNSVSSYGGLINIVTKKPFQGKGGNITVAGGSFGFKKATVDVNLSEPNNNFSFRLNAGFQQEDSWQDAGSNSAVFLSPAITYRANNRLTFNFNYEVSTVEQTNPVFLFLNRSLPAAFDNISDLNYDYDKSFTNNDVTIKNPTRNYRGEIAYKISDNWSSQTLIAGGNTKSVGYYSYLWNFADKTDPENPVASPYFALYAQRTNARTKTNNLQQNFTGDFKLGGLRNRLVIGIDYLDTQIIDKSSRFAGINAQNTQGDLIKGVPVSKAVIDAALVGKKINDKDINQNILGVYLSDVININQKLSLMAGVRYDRFDYKGDDNSPSDDEKTYTKSTFSPKFGVVFQPILNRLSLFANYQNGFSYVGPEVVPVDLNDPSAGTELQSYDLERANQIEIGAKSNLYNNKLDATLSVYHITVENKVIGFGASKIQDGTVVSKGVELELNSNPIHGLNLHGGFSYNDAKVTESKSTPNIVDKRSAEAGAEISYNFWGDYKFHKGILKNFGLGAGFNGASEYNTMSGYPAVGEFFLPAYTIFNASAYYDMEKVRVSIKANNLTDKEYYTGWSTITPQRPRSIIASLMYKF